MMKRFGLKKPQREGTKKKPQKDKDGAAMKMRERSDCSQTAASGDQQQRKLPKGEGKARSWSASVPRMSPAVCCQPKEWKASRRIPPGRAHLLPWHIWDLRLWEGNLPTE